MRPLDIQVIGEELAIRWDDGTESFIPLVKLRQACPCASCKGEVDILGNLHKGPQQMLSSESTRLLRLTPVGGYALQPVWADGHSSGLYPYDQLAALCKTLRESQSGPKNRKPLR